MPVLMERIACESSRAHETILIFSFTATSAAEPGATSFLTAQRNGA